MSATVDTAVLMVASPLGELAAMADALAAERIDVPNFALGDDEDVWQHADALDAWRAEHMRGPRAAQVVVAVWPAQHHNVPLLELSPADFARRSEWAFAEWFAALGVATARCADGGTIVAVVERPSPLDCAGWSVQSGTADAVEALVRSLARAEGPRGVRANAVTTPVRMAPARPIAPYPPLAAFPGRLDVEVTDAVAMLLGAGVGGVTGTVIHADCGRSWR